MPLYIEWLVANVLTTRNLADLPGLCQGRDKEVQQVLVELAAPLIELKRGGFAASLQELLLIFLLWGLRELRRDGKLPSAEISKDQYDDPKWGDFIALASYLGLTSPPRQAGRHDSFTAETPFKRLLAYWWKLDEASVYRRAERGRKAWAAILSGAEAPERTLSMWRFAFEVDVALGTARTEKPDAQEHQQRARRALRLRLYRPALWHASECRDADLATQIIDSGCHELAGDEVVHALLSLLGPENCGAEELVHYCVARAGLARIEGEPDAELTHLEQAMHLANTAGSLELLGVAYTARGRFYEKRDEDKSLADYRQARDLLAQASGGAARSLSPRGCNARLVATVRLGYQYTTRNDPRARDALDLAQSLLEEFDPPLDLRAMFEHASAELLRRDGKVKAAIERQLQALQIYEQIGNSQQALRALAGLVAMYGQQRDLPNARACAERVLREADVGSIDPETHSTTQLNLGAAYFWAGDLDRAIDCYRSALTVADDARLEATVGRAHYNIAEAYYTRFKTSNDPIDEDRGDAHARAAEERWRKVGSPGALAATANIKQLLLGRESELVYSKMLPDELLAHIEEFTTIQQQRRLQTTADSEHARVRATLSIAKAYAAIAAKERETALTLIRKTDDANSYETEVADIAALYSKPLSAIQRHAEQWAATLGCPTPRDRQLEVITVAIREGGLSKSRYAAVARVAPATASAHLAVLTSLRLLKRQGSGPATRYTLVALPGSSAASAPRGAPS